MANLEGHSQAILDLAWDYIGSTYATTSRDKHVRIIDARSNQIVDMIEEAHDGNKSAKVTYCGLLDKICTVGFQKGTSKRFFKIWDPRNTTSALETKELDQAAGVVMPFFDTDTNMIYFAGKGEGQVKYYEIGSNVPYVLDCSLYRSNAGAKGACMIPKRACGKLSSSMLLL
jgi:WD40 repeat protein